MSTIEVVATAQCVGCSWTLLAGFITGPDEGTRFDWQHAEPTDALLGGQHDARPRVGTIDV